MGDGLRAKCGDCGNAFIVRVGHGFNSCVLFCDKCGATVTRQGAVRWSSEMSKATCECGGHLEMDERLARCPRCKSKNWTVKSTFLWD